MPKNARRIRNKTFEAPTLIALPMTRIGKRSPMIEYIKEKALSKMKSGNFEHAIPINTSFKALLLGPRSHSKGLTSLMKK